MSSDELESLLGRDPVRLRDRAGKLFDELVSPEQPLVLYGAGGLGRKTLEGLHALGRPPVAFADSATRLHGTRVDGIPVLAPEAVVQEVGSTAAVVVTVFMGTDRVVNQVRRLGCRTVVPFYPLFWKHPSLFLPHYAYDLPDRVLSATDLIRRAFALLADEGSRREFLDQIRWRLDPAFGTVPPPCRDEIYFPPEIGPLSTHEVFVDCGGYDGDTARAFLRRTQDHFERLLIFEPDPSNFERLLQSLRSLPPDVGVRVQTHCVALGNRAGFVRFEGQGAASSALSEAGDLEVRCDRLDDLLQDTAATFIKMDIEGAELEALEGAVGHISAHRPLLAVSAYHRQDHLWRIPLAIEALSSGYRFILRRHSPEILDELVLYAVPERRA